MNWKDTGHGDFEQVEPGSYAAICNKVIDLGTQTSEYQGQKTSRRQVIIGWELSEKMMDGRPFVVSSFYTQSLHEKATLRKHLEGWRGLKFTESELKGFDPRKLLSSVCMLSLIKNETGKIRVSSISKLPKGMVAPEHSNPITFFSLDNFSEAVFNSLSNGVKKIIVQSPEYIKISSGVIDEPASPLGNEVEQAAASEDIPF